MDAEAQSALIAVAEGVQADAAAEDLPLAGRRTFVAFAAAADATRSRVRQVDPGSGALIASWTTSDATDARFQTLRAAMLRPGEGTWYWAVLEIGPAGEVDARFHYDEPPEWEGLSLRVQSSAYREDLARFPRAAPLPPWLVELLAEAD